MGEGGNRAKAVPDPAQHGYLWMDWELGRWPT